MAETIMKGKPVIDKLNEHLKSRAEALRARGMKSRLILQVHDELIVEAPQEEAQSAASLLKSCMENIVSLRVPLTAEVNIGRSWYDCK